MAEKKELRKMSRTELIEIIYALKTREEQLEQSKAALEEHLRQRVIQVEESGSIAEAAIGINQVFAAAQAAADDYLLSIRAANQDIESRCTALREQTEAECSAMRTETETYCTQLKTQTASECTSLRQQTEAECAQQREQAQRETSACWQDFQAKCDQLLAERKELQALLQLPGKKT